MLVLKGFPGLDRLFRTQAVCYDETVRATLQKGGFVYLDYPYSTEKPYVIPTAKIATIGTGTNALMTKLIYPVLIERPEPGTPRSDFRPINESGLITILLGTFECFVNIDSYFEDNTMSYPTIAAGDALKIALVPHATLEANPAYGASYIYDRPMLIKDGDGSGTFATTVAFAQTATVDGELRIKWGV